MDLGGSDGIGRLVSEIRSLKNELKGLIEINSRLTKEIISIKGTPPQSQPTTPRQQTTNITIHIDTENLKIYGNTYKHRGIFSGLGGSWDGNNKHWVLDHDQKDPLMEKLNENLVEFEVRN